jgi:FixJ family two-component response regulator
MTVTGGSVVHIAILDDDPASLRMIDKMVRLTGHEATTFASAEAFYDALDSLPYG